MEMGSSSLGSLTDSGGSSSPPNSSTESLNGLKFGQKIYFEDVGVGGVPAKPGGSGSSSSSAGSGQPKKARSGGAVPSGQPPRCQVEGCKVDLSDAKAYYSRHKVCGNHSKSPKVVVNGLEQRFCQQCSRFHQLPEFDNGKRSCRRRLAGHNERRRKPPPVSLLSSPYGRFSSSILENNSRSGGFLMDFTTHPRIPGRDAWPTARSSERVPGNQTAATGKILPPPWQSNSGNPSSNVFLQGSSCGTGYAGPGFSPGECFTGVADSGCALSLLSNQPWGSRNRASGLGANDLMNVEGTPIAQSTAPHGPAVNHYTSSISWGFKGNEADSSSSHDIRPDLALGQISQPVSSQFSGDLELSQQSGRPYMELDSSRAFDSTQQMHWSL